MSNRAVDKVDEADRRYDLDLCPWCAGPADVEHLENGRWSVGCKDEECFGYQSMTTFARKIEAVKAWNRRAALTPPEREKIARIVDPQCNCGEVAGESPDCPVHLFNSGEPRKPVDESYFAFQQRRGRLPCLIEEAIGIYSDFMKDDDYNTQGCLDRVIEKLQSARDWYDDSIALLREGEREEGGEALPFQASVQPWLMACFGAMIAGDREERNHRFLEEALELVQSLGCSASEAHQLVDYVYGREIGHPPQEVGGVMVTLAALCLANDLDMHAAGWVELNRIWGKVEQIRAKQAAKPKHGPLPGPTAPPHSQDDAR